MGCTRPDCHFLHDEYTVATYKKPRVPVQEVEVKIFLRNIPPRMNKADIALVVEPHGYIKWIHLLPSQLESGRQAAIILGGGSGSTCRRRRRARAPRLRHRASAPHPA